MSGKQDNDGGGGGGKQTGVPSDDGNSEIDKSNASLSEPHNGRESEKTVKVTSYSENSELSADGCEKTKENQNLLEQTYRDLMRDKAYFKQQITRGIWKRFTTIGKDLFVEDCRVSLWKYENSEFAKVEWKVNSNTGFQKFEVKDERDNVVSSGILQMRLDSMSFIVGNLQLGKKYSVGITTMKDVKSSNPDASFDISTCPTCPTNINICESHDAAICQWNPCGGAARYKVIVEEGKKYAVMGNVVTIPKSDYKTGHCHRIRIKAIGKEKKQKTITNWTEFKTGNGKVPFNVVMKACGCRKLNVKWSKPEKANPKHYYLTLIDGADSKIKWNATTHDAEYTFNDLPNGKSFCCMVQAVNNDDSKSEATKSDKCRTTEPAHTRKRYMIADKGKPTIHEPALNYNEKHVQCEIHWSNADIGEESKNFKLLANNLVIREIPDKGEKVISQSCGPNDQSLKNVPVSWGKKYSMTVQAVYCDLDSLEKKGAKVDKAFETRIGEPSNINVQCGSGNIIVTWDPAPGAEKYQILVKDKASNLLHHSKEVNSPQYEFTTAGRFRLGNKYNLDIEAKGNGMKTVSQHQFTLGGNLVPTNLRANKHPNDPCRSVQIIWEKPDKTEIKCTGYECSITCKKNSDTSVDKPTTVRTGTLNYTFNQLKSNTEYFGLVVAIFADGQRSTICQSNGCITDKVSRNKNEMLNQLAEGKVKNVILTPFFAPDEVKYEVTWENGEIGNLRKHFTLDCTTLRIFNRLESIKEQLIQVQPDGKNEATFSLKRGGTYLMTISTLFNDLDEGPNQTAYNEQEIRTDIEKLQNIMAECKKGQILLSWNPVVGAKHYEVKVLDGLNTGVTLHPAQNQITDTKYVFDLNRECGYGKTCKFQVTAIAFNGKKQTAEYDMIIGGDDVPTKVLAVADASPPHRKVKVTWNAPNNNQTNEYRVVLLQDNAEIDQISTNNTTVMFNELRSATTYAAYVTAYFAGNVKSENCYSNYVTTAVNPRKGDSPATKSSEFGSPKNLEYEVDISGDQPVAHLQWKRPCFGTEYKLTRYKITATSHSTAAKTFYSAECIETLKYKLPLPKHGIEYTVTVSTEFVEIDNSMAYERETNVKFFAGISEPVIIDPECSENKVKFRWSQSAGATSYIIEINDKANNGPVVSDRTNTNTFPAAINKDKLFIGRSYIVKVTAQRNNEMTSSQAVQEVFLGGEKVPRHVLPTKDIDDPFRTVAIQFDKPNANDGLKKYQVRAIPLSGKIRRILSCQDTAMKIRYLRSNTKYRFEITALYESGEKSLPSSSIWLKTDEKQSTTSTPALMSMKDATGTVDFTGAAITQQNIAASSTTILDTVCDIRTELTAESDNTDKVFITWQHPSFNRHPEDYKINSYKVELIDSHGYTTHDPVSVNPTQGENKAEFNGLRCGNKKYKVSVKTVYEDIDADRDANTSNPTTEDLFSRPKKPKISKNFPNAESQKLEIEWNPSEGANGYKLEILRDENNKDPILEILDKNARRWSCPFSENIGFGSHYKIRLTATSVSGRTNADETDFRIIGGDQVPKNSRARKNIETPNTKADISWEKPNAEPFYYLVEAFNGDICEKTSDKIVDGTQHTMSGLKPGTKYSFKVYAVYENTTSSEKKEEKRSGGCITNEITTRAAPSKIRKLNVELDKKNPSTSAIMEWEADNQSGEPDGQLTAAKFQISLTCMNRKHYQEMLTVDKEFQLSGLEPGHTYEVTVTGGNDEGFGEKSDPKSFTMNLGMPQDVKLMVNRDLPSSSVVLNFAKAEGMPSAYLATLSKGQDVVGEKKIDPECFSQIFNENIEGNTEYHAEIQAQYVIENESSPRSGEKVKSNSVSTAPLKPQSPEVELIKENDKYKAGWIKISWNALTKCNNHEIEIKKEGSEPEQTLMVTQKLSCQYQCKEEGNKYKVKMRSQNSSGYFGEWSEYAKLVQLAPADPQHVEALIEDNEIIVKWAKPQLETEFIVQVFVDGNPFGQQIAMRECSYAVAMHEERPSSTYSFGVWAEIDKFRGNMVKSNDVISKPSPGKLTAISQAKSGKDNEIVVAWEKHYECDFYQVEIKTKSSNQPENILTVEKNEGNADEPSCTYLCQCPGDTYVFRARCHYKSVFGDWSEGVSFLIVPPKVTLIESKMENNIFSLSWEPLKIPPKGYIIKVYCNGKYEKTLKIKANTTQKKIKNLIPGKKYYCEISADNAAGEGKCIKTLEHKTCVPEAFLLLEMDETNPCEVALLKWNIPEGVNCFKLIIQDKKFKQDEIPITAHLDEGEKLCKYLFERGIPGSQYEIRLHCGYDGEYNENCTIEKLTMAPASPVSLTVSRNEFQPSTSILVKFQDEISFKKKYRIVAQPHSSKDYEVFQYTVRCTTLLHGLTPGETYDVYVVCRIGDLCSPPIFSPPIQTEPLHGHLTKIAQAESDNTNEIIVSWKKYSTCNFYEVEIKRKSSAKPEIILTVKNEKEGNVDEQFCTYLCKSPGDTYVFRVRCQCNSLFGFWSEERVYQLVPCKIVGVDIERKEKEIRLFWKKPKIEPENYFLQLFNKDQMIFSTSTSDTEFIKSDLLPAMEYGFRIAASNMSVQGEWSDKKLFNTAPAPPRNVKVGLDPENPHGAIIVNFEDEKNTLKIYKVEVLERDKIFVEKLTEKQSVTISDLDPNRKYNIRVSTIYKEMSSAFAYPV